MRVMSDPKVNKENGNIEATIRLDHKELKALREALNYYLQRHKDPDPSSNVIPRMIAIEALIDHPHGKKTD